MSTRTVVGMAFTAVIASFAVTASGALSTLTPKVLKASWADAWWVPRHQAKVASAESETDVAGNKRIRRKGISIGCYEYVSGLMIRID